MDFFHPDQTTLIRLVKSLVIAGLAFGLFFGLRGRILQFAQWAGLPRLAFAPVRLLLRYAILLLAAMLILGLWGFELGTIFALLGTILGPLAETNFMTTMVSFDNDWTVFFTRPISASILALAVLGLAWPVIKAAIAHFRKAPSGGQTQAP